MLTQYEIGPPNILQLLQCKCHRTPKISVSALEQSRHLQPTACIPMHNELLKRNCLYHHRSHASELLPESFRKKASMQGLEGFEATSG